MLKQKYFNYFFIFINAFGGRCKWDESVFIEFKNKALKN